MLDILTCSVNWTPLSEILPQEDLPSSEESSESKEHFETPPATPSDLNKEKPPKHEPVVKPDVTPEVPAAAPVKQTEEVSVIYSD